MRCYPLIFPVLAVAAGPAAITFGDAPHPDRPMLVIAAPWHDASQIVAAAGGRIVGPQRAPLAVFAIGDAGFADRARASGAWSVTDGTTLAAICGAG
ncbi:hypothetical protein [Pseudoruegeria sp. HB172150]|uniref:hypothetical protein n=1 Tax=Pseudoruegeria sp. HB172150 TaxID=2721164 RepID=UPI00155798EC|nr:hypothetical protein [Pseudoruegeria sp. HB172150]